MPAAEQAEQVMNEDEDNYDEDEYLDLNMKM